MSREVEYLTNYSALQKLRTAVSPGIVIEDDIQTQGCNRQIAPMLLIPFVENAFKHGISLQEPSWIKIKLQCNAQHVFFDVRNSVHARKNDDPEKNSSGIGLANVRERLKWLYPGRHDLLVKGDDKEFSIQLVIRP
jgi:LytS/YehU family sensor histidine kinase